jgi:predicted Zn-dependent protease with MMP-like domain
MMRAALAELPEQYAERLENVEFIVLRAPLRLQRKRMGRGGSPYGLYDGIPITRRDTSYGNVTPDRIMIYWGPLMRDFPDEASLAEEVRKTVYHEIAHHFGLDDDDLRHTSVE